MAMKKKKQAKTTPMKSEEPAPERKLLPSIGPGDVTFTMSEDEVFSLVQILGFSKEVFMQMAINAMSTGDAQTKVVYEARSDLSRHLYEKIRKVASLGEPTSRDFH